ncbi:MAG: hypothetical protein N2205_03240 [Candidatus Caldatribacterium sp.]|nr:hypothetical protein [Candidatus Caldatribacterium sp.]
MFGAYPYIQGVVDFGFELDVIAKKVVLSRMPFSGVRGCLSIVIGAFVVGVFTAG